MINIGILAHVDAGKTTITEHILHCTGVTREIGSVDKGTSGIDFMEVERKRGISVRAVTTSFEWKGHQINLIDTPGHVDFSGEVERTLTALDSAVLTISAKDGIQPHTEVILTALIKMNIPVLIFINKIDTVASQTKEVTRALQEKYKLDIISCQRIEGEGTTSVKVAVNDDCRQMSEVLAMYNEEILETYLNGESLDRNEIDGYIKSLVSKGEIFPILFGSAVMGKGINELLDGIVTYLPQSNGREEEEQSGIVFKIEHDNKAGKIAYVRMYEGVLKTRDMLTLGKNDAQEKVTQIRKYTGDRYESINILKAGDIGGLCGLSSVQAGDVIGTGKGVKTFSPIAHPLMKVQVFPQNENDISRLIEALNILSEEEPLLHFTWVSETKEFHLSIIGMIQTEILSSMLENRFNLKVAFGAPGIIYKETPVRKGIGFDAYTMPKPCWAVLKFEIEPLERGKGLIYENKVSNKTLLPRYQNHVETAVPKALKQGLNGWEVTDLKVTLTEGEHHHVHTHPLDFFVATPLAIMNGLMHTGTRLLEPIMKFSISAEEDLAGKVIGDILNMKGNFESPVIKHGVFIMEGLVPAATSLEYPIRLASLTGGKGKISMHFSHYEACPPEVEATTARVGVHPADRAKFILWSRNALGEFGL